MEAAPDSPMLKRPAEDHMQDKIKRAKISASGTSEAQVEAASANPDPSPKRKTAAKRDAVGWAKSRKGKEKDGKNTGRRSRGSRNDEVPREGEAVGTESGEQTPKSTRLPKRQCALLIGFCGTGCNGMQIQRDVRTIEGVLFDAMVKAGAVSQDNADDPVKVKLGRAARTDAGVHAAGNVVSMKMITSVPGVPDIVARINEELPPEIRMWGYVRVQNSFNARLSCDSRKYIYLFPSYLLIPPNPESNLFNTLKTYEKANSSTTALPIDNGAIPHSFWEGEGATSPSIEDDLRRKRQWRVGTEQLEILRAVVKKYEGTHNFHNFTVGRDFSDRSNQRHMKKIEISDPVVYGETEWLSVHFHGQSFMLHQRKMMAALVLTCRTGALPSVISELYGPRIVFVPKMPSLGLLLDHPIFDSYNNKIARINEKLQPTDAEYRPPIDFRIHQEAIANFKQKHIYDNMRAIEDRHAIFDAWVRSVDSYKGTDLLYLNGRGIIPASATIKKGERREQPFKEKRKFDATSFPAGDDAKSTVSDEAEEEEAVVVNKAELVETEG